MTVLGTLVLGTNMWGRFPLPLTTYTGGLKTRPVQIGADDTVLGPREDARVLRYVVTSLRSPRCSWISVCLHW